MSAAKKKKKQAQILREFENLAGRLGLKVSYGDMKFGGLKLKSGQCLFKGEPWLVLNRNQPFEDKLELFRDAFGRLDLKGEKFSPEEQVLLAPLGRAFTKDSK
ncbi:MAG: hypothetical protein SV487_03335 [Thermodesulfobacteriota bacterium]|nr:hypothetical protein [Thermodesulfobacteriota bacterium]